MTDKPMMMREKMARSLAKSEAKRQLESGFAFEIDFPNGMDQDWEFYLPDVYEMLDVLEAPNPSALQAFLSVECDNPAAHARFAAMVKAIRGGA